MISSAISADLGRQDLVQGSSEALATVTGIVDGTGSIGAAVGQVRGQERGRRRVPSGPSPVAAVGGTLVLQDTAQKPGACQSSPRSGKCDLAWKAPLHFLVSSFHFCFPILPVWI